jgi:non-ribosomal peptide synthetase component F
VVGVLDAENRASISCAQADGGSLLFRRYTHAVANPTSTHIQPLLKLMHAAPAASCVAVAEAEADYRAPAEVIVMATWAGRSWQPPSQPRNFEQATVSVDDL